jgi:dihydropteroate synthase
MPLPPLRFRTGTWDWSRPYIAGVLNVTPDSFSDGGQFEGPEQAIAHGRRLVEQGADMLDIGGESTRPGAEQISADEEIARVLPVINGLADVGVPLSVDTTKARVARACLDAGAEVVNDISGGLFEPAIIEVAEHAAAYICGHVRGSTIADVHAGETEALDAAAVLADLNVIVSTHSPELRAKTIADPCLGFGKGPELNLVLCKRAGWLSDELQLPVMVGASRKRFVASLSGHVAPVPVHVRDAATVGTSLAAIEAGAQVLRVHNVEMMAAAMRLHHAVRSASR